MNSLSEPAKADERMLWNEAYNRLDAYLNALHISYRPEVARLALQLLEQAREQYRQDSSGDRTRIVMLEAQKLVSEWLAQNLGEQNLSPLEINASGGVALLLSRITQTNPAAFLAFPPSDELRQSMRSTLLFTGPDLRVSSMTPRPLDYGPMLHLAKRTWHRWNGREIAITLSFWVGVYLAFYWWLSDLL
jgi:hypothetical protein